MSSEPVWWFCHECQTGSGSIFRDPQGDFLCQACHSTFVEGFGGGSQDRPPAIQHEELDALGFFNSLFNDVPRFAPPHQPAFHMEVHSRSSRPGGGLSTTNAFFLEPPRATDGFGGLRSGGIRRPTMLEFLRGGVEDGDPLENGWRAPDDPRVHPLFHLLGLQRERMGDYVFSESALNDILLHLAENAPGRPIPATQDVINSQKKVRLTAEVLRREPFTKNPTCVICMDDFSENVRKRENLEVITLSCKHPFHHDCIVRWLGNSGTCPTCRQELASQPGQPSQPGPRSNETSHGPPSSRLPHLSRTHRSARSPTPQQAPSTSRQGNTSGSSRFNSLFSGQGGDGHSRGHDSRQHDSRQHRSSRDPRDAPHFPGGWGYSRN